MFILFIFSDIQDFIKENIFIFPVCIFYLNQHFFAIETI